MLICLARSSGTLVWRLKVFETLLRLLLLRGQSGMGRSKSDLDAAPPSEAFLDRNWTECLKADLEERLWMPLSDVGWPASGRGWPVSGRPVSGRPVSGLPASGRPVSADILKYFSSGFDCFINCSGVEGRFKRGSGDGAALLAFDPRSDKPDDFIVDGIWQPRRRTKTRSRDWSRGVSHGRSRDRSFPFGFDGVLLMADSMLLDHKKRLKTPVPISAVSSWSESQRSTVLRDMADLGWTATGAVLLEQDDRLNIAWWCCPLNRSTWVDGGSFRWHLTLSGAAGGDTGEGARGQSSATLLILSDSKMAVSSMSDLALGDRLSSDLALDGRCSTCSSSIEEGLPGLRIGDGGALQSVRNIRTAVWEVCRWRRAATTDDCGLTASLWTSPGIVDSGVVGLTNDAFVTAGWMGVDGRLGRACPGDSVVTTGWSVKAANVPGDTT